MIMRFIADENIPGLLVNRLLDLGHDVVLCPKSRSDMAVAKLADMLRCQASL